MRVEALEFFGYWGCLFSLPFKPQVLMLLAHKVNKVLQKVYKRYQDRVLAQ